MCPLPTAMTVADAAVAVVATAKAVAAAVATGVEDVAIAAPPPVTSPT